MENIKISIREAGQDDFEKISDLAKQLGHAITPDEAKTRLVAISGLGDQKLFVAESESEVIGMISVVVNTELLSGTQARLLGLVVDMNFRRGGVGQMLLNHAEDWAKKMGSQTMKLASNKIRCEAHTFYEKNGYIKYKEQVVFKKELK